MRERGVCWSSDGSHPKKGTGVNPGKRGGAGGGAGGTPGDDESTHSCRAGGTG